MNEKDGLKVERIESVLKEYRDNVDLIRTNFSEPVFEEVLLKANRDALHASLVKVFSYDD